MKKSLKSIARSLRLMVAYQMRHDRNWRTSIGIQSQNLDINREVLRHSRDANRMVLTRFELEHTQFIGVLDGLIALIPADLGRQEPVEEAKRLVGLMKSVNEK